MEKIEGLSLDQIVKDAQTEIVSERRHEAIKAVRGMLANVHAWRVEISRAQKLIEKRERQIVDAESKLERIRGGDWSLLQTDATQAHASKDIVRTAKEEGL